MRSGGEREIEPFVFLVPQHPYKTQHQTSGELQQDTKFPAGFGVLRCCRGFGRSTTRGVEPISALVVLANLLVVPQNSADPLNAQSPPQSLLDPTYLLFCNGTAEKSARPQFDSLAECPAKIRGDSPPWPLWP